MHSRLRRLRVQPVLIAGFAVFFALGCSSAPIVGSIGAVLGRDPDTRDVFVREASEPSPTATGPHLIPGDQLVMVEGVFVRDLSTKELRALLRGAPGSEVAITVARGSEVLRMHIKRTALKSKLLSSATKEERVSEE